MPPIIFEKLEETDSITPLVEYLVHLRWGQVAAHKPGKLINNGKVAMIIMLTDKNCAKGTTDPRVECSYWSNLFRSYHKFLHKSWWKFIFRMWTKHQLQNLNRTSSSRLNLNFKILTKRSFRISTKIQPYNLNQTSVAKYWSNFGLKLKISPDLHKILTKPCAQSLNKK